MKAGPRNELRALQRSVQELEQQFLEPHLTGPTLAQPAREEVLDAAAFIVLLHGVMEDFAEGLAQWLVSRSVVSWVSTTPRLSRSTASALLHRTAPEEPVGTKVFDSIRKALEEAKSATARLIESNNGISQKHLHELFFPLGVDVPQDPVLMASLESVVRMRHHWAHKFRYGATVVKSAADAQLAARDCLTLAERLSDAAVKLRP